jgi:hypothetical protein
VDWTVYWFMLPVASVAMFSGISGAAMLTPVSDGLPAAGRAQAHRRRGDRHVAAAGDLPGFGTGAVTLPLGALGAVADRHRPASALRIGYGVAMLGFTLLLAHKPPGGSAAEGPVPPALVSQSDRSHPPCGHGQARPLSLDLPIGPASAAPLARRQRFGEREARPPSLRKSRSASVGATAAARW